MDVGEWLGIGGTVLSLAALYFSRKDRGQDELKATVAGLASSIDRLRNDLNDHKVDAARMYVNRDDLRGVSGRIEALITRIDDFAGRR